VSREEERRVAGLRTVAVGEPDASVVMVLLHGFAMSPADLSPFAHSIGVNALFLLPEGPKPGALTPGVPQGRAWWHIDPVRRLEALAKGPRDFAEQHPPDLPDARALLGAVLDEAFVIAAGRPLILGGFSQGGMLTFDTLVRGPRPIAAVALLSGSRIAWDEQEAFVARRPLAGVATLVSHGTADDDLAFTTGEALREAAIAAGADVTWVPFDQGHEIPLVVWRRLRKLLLSVGGVR